MRILIVRLSSFGDVIHTFPALSDLAIARRDVEVDWLVEEGFAGLAALHPALRSAIPFAQRRLRWPPARWPVFARELAALRRQLQARRYDLVIDLQGLLKSAWLARLAGAPIAGYDRSSIREPVAARFYQQHHAVSRALHAVERNRQLLAAALGYALPSEKGQFGVVPPSLPAEAPAEPYGVLMHSASWPSKLWPEENWRRLAAHLSQSGQMFILPWGNDEERARAARIAEGNPSAQVLPRRLGGAELGAWLGGARFAIGLDSGLMHLAAALRVPGIWLFGPTDPGLTGPYGGNQIVLRSASPHAPCRRRVCAHGALSCMDGISPEEVIAAAEQLMPSIGQSV